MVKLERRWACLAGDLGMHWVFRLHPTECPHRDRDVGVELRNAHGACCGRRSEILRIVESAVIEWGSSSGGGKGYRRRVDGEATCMQKGTYKETIGSASKLKHRSARRYLKWGIAKTRKVVACLHVCLTLVSLCLSVRTSPRV